MNKRKTQTLTHLLLLAIALAGCNSLGWLAVPLETATPTIAPTSSPESPLTGRKIVAKGKYLYFKIGYKIQAIDVSNVQKPILLGDVLTYLPSDLLVLFKDKLYGFNLQPASSSKGSNKIISIIDVSNPSLMQVNSYEPEKMVDPSIKDATVLGDGAYLIMGYQRPNGYTYRKGLLTLDVSQPDNLKQLWFDTNIPVGKITAIAPSTFYITEYTPKKYVVHIFRLENDGQLVGAGDLCSECDVLAVDDAVIYVQKTTYTKTKTISILTSYDIHNPLAPVLIRSYKAIDFRGSTVKQSKLYAVDKDVMKIYSLEKNGDISKLGFFDLRGTISEMFISDKIAYLAVNNADLILVDISNPASPKQVAHYNVLGYTFTENPETIPDPSDIQPPSCTSIKDELPVGGAPGTVLEINVPLVATDTQNSVTYMRSSNDGIEWSDWMPYHSPHKLLIGISVNWSSVSIQMQYRDRAGNISNPCSWSRITEGW